jgi:hypothetical protein
MYSFSASDGEKVVAGRMRCPRFAIKPDEGKFTTALTGKAGRSTTHDNGLIKNANGHIEAGPMPDLPSQPELGPAQPRL